MQERLDAARENLQTMMARWRPEWRDIMNSWSKKIIIEALEVHGMRCERVVLPRNYDGLFNIIADPSREIQEYSISSAVGYRIRQLRDETVQVPINLFVDVYRHFVIAFGGIFSAESSHSYYYNPTNYLTQWLYNDHDDDKRHHKIIHESLATISSILLDDGWEQVYLQGIQLGGKLLPVHYIKDLGTHLGRHQVGKMIEQYFYSTGRGEEIVKLAKEFERRLSFRMGETFIIVDGTYQQLLNEIDGNEDDQRKVMKTFDLEDETDHRHHWPTLLKNPQFVKFCGELTIADVRFLICCRIDAECDRKELVKKVKLSAASTSSAIAFPTADDHFSNFDFPHLRGLLAETVLSKKLAKCPLAKEEIKTTDLAAIAPLALTEIVCDYYSVDLSE